MPPDLDSRLFQGTLQSSMTCISSADVLGGSGGSLLELILMLTGLDIVSPRATTPSFVI